MKAKYKILQQCITKCEHFKDGLRTKMKPHQNPQFLKKKKTLPQYHHSRTGIYTSSFLL